MKKYSLIGIIGLCILIVCTVGRMMRNKRLSLPFLGAEQKTLLAYLPVTTDQLVLVEMTPETKSFLLRTNQEFEQKTFQELLDTISQVTIAQASPQGQETFAIIAFKGNEQFSIDQVQALGLLYFDTGYESKQLDEQIWVYGDSQSIAYFTSPGQSLADDSDMQQVMQYAKRQQAPLIFFSRPTGKLGTDVMTNIFAQKLAYTSVFGKPHDQKVSGAAVVQFSGVQFSQHDDLFTPIYTDSLTKDTVLYIETKNILQAFGVSETQFSLGATLFLKQLLPGAENLLTAAQVTSIYTSWNKQLGITLNTTENTFGLEMAFHFGSPDMYEILFSLQPVRKSLGTAFMGSGMLQEETGENKRGLHIGLPIPGEEMPGVSVSGDQQEQTGQQMISFPLLSLTKDTTSTTLRLLPTDKTGTPLPDALLYEPNTVASFRYDTAPLIKIAGTNPIMSNILGQTELLGTGILLGHVAVDADKQQLVVTFETK